MRRSDFHYELPPELIAQAPPATRSGGRLLCLEGAVNVDRRITDLPALLREGDLVVLNDSRVLAARLHGEKSTGGKVEILIERVLGERIALAQVRASKTPKTGNRIRVHGDAASFIVCGRAGEFFQLELEGEGTIAALLDRAGHIPLPPYIEREDAAADRERYQTVFAREPGAVAAPTAGLHFDAALLEAIRARGVEFGYVTLHVGAGTFSPVRVENLSAHQMHRERVKVGPVLCEQVAAAKQRGGRVVAIGTTVVRSLETAAQAHGPGSPLQPFEGETALFITPGFPFHAVDALMTNFHLPESTLLMLVSAFAGRERVLAAYAHAVRERYRFFSYGDAMFIPARL